MDSTESDTDSSCLSPELTETSYDELKFFDKTLGTTVVTTAGILEATVNDIIQGPCDDERVGRKVTLRSLEVKGQMVLVSTTARADTTNRVRLVWYIDHQTNGVVAAVLELLATAGLESFRNLPNQGRFSILYDCTFDLNCRCAGTADFGAFTQGFEFKVPLNLPIEFSGTTGLLATIRSNNIGFLMISKRSIGSTVEWHSRVRYTDD